MKQVTLDYDEYLELEYAKEVLEQLLANTVVTYYPYTPAYSIYFPKDILLAVLGICDELEMECDIGFLDDYFYNRFN